MENFCTSYRNKGNFASKCNEINNFCYPFSTKRQKIREEKKLSEKTHENEEFNSEPIINDQETEEKIEEIQDKHIFPPGYKISDILKELEKHYKLYIQGHIKEVTRLAISSDNKYIISGSDDRKIRI